MKSINNYTLQMPNNISAETLQAPAFYSGFNDPDRWVLPAVLAEQAKRQPDANWIETTDGEHCTFGEAWRDARKAAGWFVSQGVRPRDRVAVMMGNHLDFVRAWLGLGVLGATAVLLNTELQGAFLAHQLRNCEATLALVDGTLVEAVDGISPDVPTLQRLAVSGARKETRLPQIDWCGWRAAPEWDGPLPAAHDIACVMYTSGTSGPAKGVLMPHAHCTLYGIGTSRSVELTAQDRYYITLPLFHANGLLMQLGATLLAGIPAILRNRFSASSWLNDVRSHRATVTNLLGSTAAFVVGQPASDYDARHRLRAVCVGPNLPAHEAVFRERFGIASVVSGFGMTEVNIPVWGHLDRPCPGAAGWVHESHFEVIIADPATDREVPRGQLGEILVRPKVPFGFMAGYLGMPERTVEAWRNLWFHTGDAATMDSEGLLTFVDRIKDCIRRRGENISANEVESQIAGLPGVAEVVAYAVPSAIPGGEDELALAIVPSAHAELNIEALVMQADRALPRFARPDYVRVVAALPRTATGKVQRAVLRQDGIANAWRRERIS
ncbi:AMP-binding protein [Herbaspirillum sp. GCM10030257]|uniref:AMP-binding protein n=1 Tax=Herbaspirillum sp. GCM10030257 TaxID=3273393 RepID=UPI003617329D